MRHGLADSARIICPVDRYVLVHDDITPRRDFVPLIDDLTVLNKAVNRTAADIGRSVRLSRKHVQT